MLYSLGNGSKVPGYLFDEVALLGNDSNVPGHVLDETESLGSDSNVPGRIDELQLLGNDSNHVLVKTESLGNVPVLGYDRVIRMVLMRPFFR
jgi:hypothetical protein